MVERFKITQIPSWIRVEDVDILGREKALNAASAAVRWSRVYKAGRDIKIKVLIKDLLRDLGAAESGDTNEVAEPGLIMLSEDAEPHNTVLHAMTHACKKDDPTVLNEQIPFSGGLITGFHGLALLLTLNSGEKTKFQLFEEAVSERNAAFFKGYSVPNIKYFSIGKMRRNEFPYNRFTKLYELVRSNNIPQFVKASLHVPSKTQINGALIEEAMQKYQMAWNSAQYY